MNQFHHRCEKCFWRLFSPLDSCSCLKTRHHMSTQNSRILNSEFPFGEMEKTSQRVGLTHYQCTQFADHQWHVWTFSPLNLRFGSVHPIDWDKLLARDYLSSTHCSPSPHRIYRTRKLRYFSSSLDIEISSPKLCSPRTQRYGMIQSVRLHLFCSIDTNIQFLSCLAGLPRNSEFATEFHWIQFPNENCIQFFMLELIGAGCALEKKLVHWFVCLAERKLTVASTRFWGFLCDLIPKVGIDWQPL